jgi:hypothetical protein
MKSFKEYIDEYKKQMKKGDIREAYKGIMEYILELKLHFKNKYPEYFISGNVYFGYMDMTYFSFTPESLKSRKLKTAIVFLHETCRFEIWLSGYNKQVQKQYWELVREKNWNKYHIPLTIKGSDSIIEHVMVENPDFGNLDLLTEQIESEALEFIRDIERFFSDSKIQ